MKSFHATCNAWNTLISRDLLQINQAYRRIGVECAVMECAIHTQNMRVCVLLLLMFPLLSIDSSPPILPMCQVYNSNEYPLLHYYIMLANLIGSILLNKCVCYPTVMSCAHWFRVFHFSFANWMHFTCVNVCAAVIMSLLKQLWLDPIRLHFIRLAKNTLLRCWRWDYSITVCIQVDSLCGHYHYHCCDAVTVVNLFHLSTCSIVVW